MNCVMCHQVMFRAIGAKFCHPCMVEHSKLRSKALGKIMNEKLTGRLAHANTMQCVDCQLPADVWEHRDYDKPLDVVPVCYKCNRRRGISIASQFRTE